MNEIPLRVREYMTRELITISADTDIAQAVHLLLEHDISGLLVSDDSGGIAGVFTERDCIAVASEAGYYEQWGGPVANYMSAPVETVGPTGPETAGGWILHSFDAGSLIDLTDQVRLRFVAADLGQLSIVEAAIDDVLVVSVQCASGTPERARPRSAPLDGSSRREIR